MNVVTKLPTAARPVDPVWGLKDVTSGKGAGDENFPVGTIIISRPLRRHVYAYYNFARVIDDMVDNDRLTPKAKIARLRGMTEVIRGEREAPQRADAQTAVTLRRTFLETGVSLDTATDLVEAFCQDAVKGRYESWDELLDYCKYSANPVGRFLLELHGEDADTLAPSDALCSALQVLNHLQDAASDLKTLDRCYLPLPWLAEEGVKVDDLRLARSKAGLRRVFDRLLDKVDELNAEARRLPDLVRGRRMRIYCAVIVALSLRLAERLRQQDPVSERVKLTPGDGIRALAWSARYLL